MFALGLLVVNLNVEAALDEVGEFGYGVGGHGKVSPVDDEPLYPGGETGSWRNFFERIRRTAKRGLDGPIAVNALSPK
jgi:hypothetical protein